MRTSTDASVPSESLVFYCEFSRIFRNFISQSQVISLLKKSETTYHFTSHFSTRVKGIICSLFISQTNWKHFLFHFILKKKMSEIMHLIFMKQSKFSEVEEALTQSILIPGSGRSGCLFWFYGALMNSSKLCISFDDTSLC